MRQSCLIWTLTAGPGPVLPNFSLRTARRILLSLVLLLGASCASASGGFSVSTIPVETRRFEVVAPGEETTLSWWSVDLGIIGLPLSEPPVARAEQELLDRSQGDALVNLRYWNDRSVFLFIVNRQRFHLKADVIRFTDRK